MTFKDLEWKKVKELISPFVNWQTNSLAICGNFKEHVLFSYFGEHNMCVQYIAKYNNESAIKKYDWEYEICRNYFDVLRLVPKIKETYLEIKFSGYHEKLKRIQDDC